jgi:hypothetical protein
MKINKLWNWLFNPPLDGPSAIILLRLMAGGVFLWEGILKFIYVNQGVGRFTKLGLPFPEATANMVGVLEIVGGILSLNHWLSHSANRHPVRNRDAGRDVINQNCFVYGNFSFAAASGSAADWILGSIARDTFGIRTVDDHNVLAYCRAGAMVPGRATDPTDERGKASAT